MYVYVALWKAKKESNLVQTNLLTKKQAMDNLYSEKQHLDW